MFKETKENWINGVSNDFENFVWAILGIFLIVIIVVIFY